MSQSQRLSIQDINKQRQRQEFVGRQEQKSFFRQNLQYDLNDERKRFIISISGPGGVGKTWLMKQFQEIAGEKEIEAISAFIDERVSSVPDALKQIADQFEPQGYILNSFTDQYRAYLQDIYAGEADPEVKHEVSGSLARVLAKGGLQLMRLVPFGAMVADSLGQEAVEFGGQFYKYVAGKVSNKADLESLPKAPEVELSKRFLGDIQSVDEKRPVILFFDTYERTGDFLDNWLRQLIKGDYGSVSANILIVIAGHHPLDKNNWSDYEGLVARLPLDPFSREEATEYLVRKGVTDETTIEVILQISGRLPLHVAMLATESPNDPSKIGDSNGEVLERFLKWIENPSQRQLAVDAAIPRYFNRDIIAEIVGPEEAGSLFNWLKEGPFVEKLDIGWIYHEVVRAQMLRYKRVETPQGWSDSQRKLAEHYENLRDSLALDKKNTRKDKIWQSYTLEAIYHRLCQAPRANQETVLRSFIANFKVPYLVFTIYYADIIYSAGLDISDSELQDWGRRLYEGVVGYWYTEYKPTINMFSSLLHRLDLPAEERATILDWRGYLYSSPTIGDYPKAFEDLNEAIDLVPNEADYWVDRGRTYMLMGKQDEALADLNQAIKLDSNNTWALRIRAQNYMRMSRYSDALTDYNQFIDLEPNSIGAVIQRGEIFWRMGRSTEALADLDYVLERDPENVRTLFLRGETYWQMGQYVEALADFNQVIEIASDSIGGIVSRGETYLSMELYDEALSDFNQAIELESNYARAFVGRGETYRRKKNLDSALADLNQAVELEPSYTSALFHRGYTLFQKGEHSEALTDLDRVIELRPENDWYRYTRFLIYSTLDREKEAQSDLIAAIQQAQQRLEAEPQDWRNVFNLALYNLAAGEAKEAERFYKSALSENASAFRVQDAIRDVKDFLGIFPSHSLAHAKLQLLQRGLKGSE